MRIGWDNIAIVLVARLVRGKRLKIIILVKVSRLGIVRPGWGMWQSQGRRRGPQDFSLRGINDDDYADNGKSGNRNDDYAKNINDDPE